MRNTKRRRLSFPEATAVVAPLAPPATPKKKKAKAKKKNFLTKTDNNA
jgi:hypothetical protein